MMKNLRIRFKNMKAVRVGKGIAVRRERVNLSLLQLSEKSGVSESKLRRLEEGCEPEVESEDLERITTALGMRSRGKPSIEDLVNFFLFVPENEDRQLTFI
jgi:DNA-binding Xre family transcriptional regulator